jgi:uncharacterized membrane protein HdeD (DUF308 family)
MTPVAGLFFGVIGLATLLIEPTVGLVSGLVGIACSWLALRTRRSSSARWGLLLNVTVVAAVLMLVIFGSGSKSATGSGGLPAI